MTQLYSHGDQEYRQRVTRVAESAGNYLGLSPTNLRNELCKKAPSRWSGSKDIAAFTQGFEQLLLSIVEDSSYDRLVRQEAQRLISTILDICRTHWVVSSRGFQTGKTCRLLLRELNKTVLSNISLEKCAQEMERLHSITFIRLPVLSALFPSPRVILQVHSMKTRPWLNKLYNILTTNDSKYRIFEGTMSAWTFDATYSLFYDIPKFHVMPNRSKKILSIGFVEDVTADHYEQYTFTTYTCRLGFDCSLRDEGLSFILRARQDDRLRYVSKSIDPIPPIFGAKSGMLISGAGLSLVWTFERFVVFVASLISDTFTLSDAYQH